MRRSSRLFEIIKVLRRARAPVPAHALAAMLEVNKRTVYRDIATLQAMRVPIAGEAGVGYVMRRGFDLPPLMFTAEEIEAITVGLALVGRTRDGGLQRAAVRVREKLADVVPQEIGPIDAIPLHASTWSDLPACEVDCALIRRAIREERKLRFDYRAVPTAATTRTVKPLMLTYWIEGIVLGGWCELRAGYRHFRLDRMAACAITSEGFAGEGQRLRAAWASEGEVHGCADAVEAASAGSGAGAGL